MSGQIELLQQRSWYTLVTLNRVTFPTIRSNPVLSETLITSYFYCCVRYAFLRSWHGSILSRKSPSLQPCIVCTASTGSRVTRRAVKRDYAIHPRTRELYNKSFAWNPCESVTIISPPDTTDRHHVSPGTQTRAHARSDLTSTCISFSLYRCVVYEPFTLPCSFVVR